MRVSAAPIVTSLALLVVSLAGCASEDPSVDEAAGAFDQFEIDVDEANGAIRGVVVDPAIRPIADATVYYTVDGDTFMTTSNEQGAFVITGIPAGTYELTAEKEGYSTVQTQTTVVAGVKAPDIIRVMLQPDISQLPRFMVHQFDGYVQCSISTPAYRVAVCSLIPEGYSNDKFLAVHDIDPGAQFIQSEMVWQSSQALGREMLLTVEKDASAEGRGADGAGPSPIVVRVEEDAMQSSGLNASPTVQLRVFNYNLQETQPPVPVCGIPNPIHGGDMCVKGIGATIEQDFSVFSHVFYRFSPDEAWQFSIDGDPVAPEI